MECLLILTCSGSPRLSFPYWHTFWPLCGADRMFTGSGVMRTQAPGSTWPPATSAPQGKSNYVTLWKTGETGKYYFQTQCNAIHGKHIYSCMHEWLLLSQPTQALCIPSGWDTQWLWWKQLQDLSMSQSTKDVTITSLIINESSKIIFLGCCLDKASTCKITLGYGN